MSDSDPWLNNYLVVDHLERDFEGAFNHAEIRSYVTKAISDLRGSICAEALPEMAYKLASHRLKAQLDQAASLKTDDLVGAARR